MRAIVVGAGGTTRAVLKRLDGDDPDEIGIRFSLALMLVFVGLALVLGIEPILGAFLAGTMVAVVFRNRVLFIAALAVKMVPAMLLVLRRHSPREALAVGALMSARLSLIIVVAELRVRLGLISETLRAEIGLLAAVIATVAPARFKLLVLRVPDDPDPVQRRSTNGGPTR